MYSSLRFLRRAAATALGPCCERLLLVLHAMRAHGLTKMGLEASDEEAIVQHMLRLSLAVETETEKELLALGEFYLWWRGERDLQEGETLDGYTVGHDVLTTVEFVQRGFMNPLLLRLLSATDVLEPLRPQEQTPVDLQAVLAETEALLDSPPPRAGDSLVLSPALPTYEQVEQVFQSSFSVPGPGDTTESGPGELPPLNVRGSLWALAAHVVQSLASHFSECPIELVLPPAQHAWSMLAPPRMGLVPPHQLISFAPGSDSVAPPLDEVETSVNVSCLDEAQVALAMHIPDPDNRQQHLIQLVRLRNSVVTHQTVIEVILSSPDELRTVRVLPRRGDGDIVILLRTPRGQRLLHAPLSQIFAATSEESLVSAELPRQRWRLPAADRTVGQTYGGNAHVSLMSVALPPEEKEWPVAGLATEQSRLAVVLASPDDPASSTEVGSQTLVYWDWDWEAPEPPSI